MQRALGTLTMLAAGLLLVAILTAGDGAAIGGALAQTLGSYAGTLDKPSFASGVIAGLVGNAIYRVPWAEYPRRLFAALLGCRRGFMLTSLAVAFTGVLLFY